MSDVNAKVVMDLRQRTGSGLMDCKKALAETGGDMEKAIEYLRKKGIASASKKAEREARQGGVFARTEGGKGVLMELNCETDFVARNENFQQLAADLLDILIKGQDVPEETLKEAIARLGENIVLRNVVRFDGNEVFAYIHAGGRVGAMVLGTGLGEAAGKDLAMQATAQSPTYLKPEEVPAEVIEKEKEIYAELCKKEGKPEVAWPKIIEGRLQKWFSDTCLLEQEHWKEAKQKVKDTLPKGATVDKFVRVELGQG